MEVEYKPDPPFELSFEARLREITVAIKQNTEAVEKLRVAIERMLEVGQWVK